MEGFVNVFSLGKPVLAPNALQQAQPKHRNEAAYPEARRRYGSRAAPKLFDLHTSAGCSEPRIEEHDAHWKPVVMSEYIVVVVAVMPSACSVRQQVLQGMHQLQSETSTNDPSPQSS